jgi:hypothetical protein
MVMRKIIIHFAETQAGLELLIREKKSLEFITPLVNTLNNTQNRPIMSQIELENDLYEHSAE